MVSPSPYTIPYCTDDLGKCLHYIDGVNTLVVSVKALVTLVVGVNVHATLVVSLYAPNNLVVIVHTYVTLMVSYINVT